MTDLSPPPVPAKLREMLKDHPGHIDRLQEALNTAIEKSPHLTPPFEVAIWALESRLEAFVREAQTDFDAAQADGVAEDIALAEQKELLMLKASSKYAWFTDESLCDHFQQNQDSILRRG
ncbi:hypothetical protein [Lysobacter antibioticus]|uniref:hypothetical protein n=1 Tax=Lysobacter antibioticus TaxID=84531 RepID=UPI00118764AE|nr:hypothetical protein [Lysobacter antibioticus]